MQLHNSDKEYILDCFEAPQVPAIRLEKDGPLRKLVHAATFGKLHAVLHIGNKKTFLTLNFPPKKKVFEKCFFFLRV